jgi:hypothetical protein
MIAQLVERGFRVSERATGESVDFLRDMFRASASSVFKFGLFLPLANHRATAPLDAYYVARLVAVMREDCGPCLQTIITYALRDNVSRELIRATMRGDTEALGEPLATVHRYVEAVVDCDPDAADLAMTVAEIYGERALVDLALAIATTRVFPTVKRGLGYARSCATTAIDV